MSHKPLSFIDNPSILGKEDKYIKIIVDLDKIIRSWRNSLFSFEWLLPDGTLRARDELITKEQHKYDIVAQKLENNQAIFLPILGIGVMDNVEIGSGRENLLTLYAHEIKSIPVHIPKSVEKEFKSFLAK